MVLSNPPDAVIFPPSDLYSDEPPLETDHHLRQILLLLDCLEWWWRDRSDAPETRRDNFYAAGNLTIYYSNRQRQNEHFRSPDFFVVLDTEYKERKSWVVWEEDGKYPNVIVEMLSESTAEVDRGLKKDLYQNIFSTPEYFWFDPYSLEFEVFRLLERFYEAIVPTERGWLWSRQLELYLGVVEEKLRFFTPEGVLVPAPIEAALEERSHTETERQRADVAEAQLERLRRQIQERGIDL